MSNEDRRIDDAGPDVLRASVKGDSIDELKLAALDHARRLYGDDVSLSIEGVSDLYVAPVSGKFIATVRVRCLNLPEGF